MIFKEKILLSRKSNFSLPPPIGRGLGRTGTKKGTRKTNKDRGCFLLNYEPFPWFRTDKYFLDWFVTPYLSNPYLVRNTRMWQKGEHFVVRNTPRQLVLTFLLLLSSSHKFLVWIMRKQQGYNLEITVLIWGKICSRNLRMRHLCALCFRTESLISITKCRRYISQNQYQYTI